MLKLGTKCWISAFNAQGVERYYSSWTGSRSSENLSSRSGGAQGETQETIYHPLWQLFTKEAIKSFKKKWIKSIGMASCLYCSVLYVPLFVPLPLAQAKNGDKQFWKQKFHAANEKAPYALMRGLLYFLFEGGRDFFVFFPCSQCFPIVFPRGSSSSQFVSLDVPNSTSVLSQVVCPKFNSHVY